MKYTNYIGLPYKDLGRDESGIDCWGLVRLFYKNEFNIEIPSYAEDYKGPQDPLLIEAVEKNKPDHWVRITEPEVGSVILFNIAGEPTHVGIYIGDGKFLHSREGLDSVIDSLNSQKWARRVEGFYKYSDVVTIPVAGSPHPFRTRLVTEAAAEGSSLADVWEIVRKKYELNETLVDHVVIMVDGLVIPKETWANVYPKEGQSVAYKVVPKGKQALRLVLTLAVAFFAAQYLPGLMQGASAGMIYAAQTATMMIGSLLINAILPIRPPTVENPGTAKSVNLFSGASNQANKFGAIPVVLGRVRMSAMLGAAPYAETFTDTSILNLMLVWGFGPLSIKDVCVGTRGLDTFFDAANQKPLLINYNGLPGTTADNLDSQYPGDIEQIYPSMNLVNTTAEGVQPYVVSFSNPCEEIDLVFNFPEGMRAVSTESGDTLPAEAKLEVLIRKQGTTEWSALSPWGVGSYSTGNYDLVAQSFDILGSSISYIDPYDRDGSQRTDQLYQWHVICVKSGGGLAIVSGTPFDMADGSISPRLLKMYNSGSYSTLVGTTGKYSVMPEIPNGYLQIHAIKLRGATRVETVSYLSMYNAVGLALSFADLYVPGPEEGLLLAGIKVSVTSGRIMSSGEPAPGETETIFTSLQFTTGAYPIAAGDKAGSWSQLLKDYGVWAQTPRSKEFSASQSVNFPYTGYYVFEASVDDYGQVLVDGLSVLEVSDPGYSGTVKNSIYIRAGNHTVVLKGNNKPAKNSNPPVYDNPAGAALKITYTANIGLNSPSTMGTVLAFGTEGFFYKRKDAFNFVHRIRGLERARYEVKVTRTSTSEAEPEGSKRRFYFASVLYSAIGYDYHYDDGSVKKIIKDPKGAPIARSYVRIQSTNKVNGTIEGVNALVCTMAPDWDHETNSWVFRETNNPASLFLYILTHPANAYRIPMEDISNKVDMPTIIAWHEFCRVGIPGTPLTYNAVLTNITSVMEALRDVASAGKASPSFVDGKWTVVIDKPRGYEVQHFTPHNSWGFESTKVLPRIPDAFRVVFNNEDKAYQSDEFFVYSAGKNETNASIFEELQLPGITNKKHAKHIAQWHMAQTYVRPETYSLNVDFEYIVCTRGDVVRVSHDVPMWGNGSGRITSIVGNTIGLSEEIYLLTGKSYNIRVRNSVGASVLVPLLPVVVPGYYDTIQLSREFSVQEAVEVGDLFMLGEVNRETQQLVVLSIEPMDNLSAKLTLCDYSPQIYTTDLDAGYPVFDPNITNTDVDVVNNGIYLTPEITNIVSDSPMSEEISRGVYQNVLMVSFASAAGAGRNAERIEVQILPSDEIFDNTSMQNSYSIPKEQSSIRITSLKTGGMYKLRARYTNSTKSISGPWTREYVVTNSGRDTNNYAAPNLVVVLDNTNIIATVPADLNKPADFDKFEFRMYKDTGVEDFWDLDPAAHGILITQGTSEGIFNLLDVPLPRISKDGITYRIACRALDRSGNYSASSTMGTVIVSTIV